MWTSVPQMVVVVMRMTACPARGVGLGRSSMASRPFPRNATAFMVSIAAAPSVVSERAVRMASTRTRAGYGQSNCRALGGAAEGA